MAGEASLIRFYQGNRFIGRTHPVAVVLGDTTIKEIPFAEHFIFHSVPNVPFLYQRVSAAQEDRFDSLDYSEFPEVYSAQALLDYELVRARDCFEFAISQQDPELHRQLFWSDGSFEFVQIDQHPFAQFRIFGTFTAEMETMFAFTGSRSLRMIGRKITQYPQCSWRTEPTP